MGLRNIRQLDAHFGSPHQKYPIIHVAGTNGKGTTCWKLAAALEEEGYRTGLYTSPHISSFRERMRINREPISEDDVTTIMSEVLAVSESKGIPSTFFELTTMGAMHYFAQSKVDAVVLETGLGGRLDATNIVHPEVSVITSIGLDHTRILGSSIEHIAREKAGIIKDSTPVVVGSRVPIPLLRSIAESHNAPFYSPPDAVEDLECDAGGDYLPLPNLDAETSFLVNQTLDLFSCPVDLVARAEGCAAPVPARMELVGVFGSLDGPWEADVEPSKEDTPLASVLFDVAHNPASLRALFTRLRNLYPTYWTNGSDGLAHPRLQVVFGLSSDRDLNRCADALTDFVAPSSVHVVEADTTRAAPAMDVAAAVAKIADNMATGVVVDEPLMPDEENEGVYDPTIQEAHMAVTRVVGSVHPRVVVEETEDEEQEHQQHKVGGGGMSVDDPVSENGRIEDRSEDDGSEPSDAKANAIDPDTGLGWRYVSEGEGSSAAVSPVGRGLRTAVHAALDGGAIVSDEDSVPPPPLVVVCGSVYILREAREAAGVVEPRDRVAK